MSKGKSYIEQRLDRMEIAFDQEEVVVIDMGSGFIKAGFSGEDVPRFCIPSAVVEHVIEVDEATANQPGYDAKPKTINTFGKDAIA